MKPVLESLPILIFDLFSHCNCRCVMCDIWKRETVQRFSYEDLARQLPSVEKLNVKWVVLTGGEPLMHPELFRLCAPLKQLGIRITLLSTGLLLRRFAAEVVQDIDDVIVSLDGPATIHNRIRGVPDAFERLARGIAAVRRLRPSFPITARSTVQRRNCRCVAATIQAARELGCDSISFLAADTHSTAFNRLSGVLLESVLDLRLTEDDLEILSGEFERIVASGECGRFVREGAEKLRRIVEHGRAALGLSEPVAPVCNAPWVSAVIEPDGAVRPCFFHRSIGHIGSGITLDAMVNGPESIAFRSGLKIESNDVCRRCVCSLHWK